MSPERYSSQDADPTLLGEKLTFNCGRTAQNRFLKAGMSERLGTWDLDVSKRGIPTDRLINAYEKWGHGGFGLIVSGNVPVDPHHLQLPGNVVVCKENDSHELREQMRRWSAVTKKEGSLAILQLTHAGALTPFSVNPTPFGPSDVHIVSKKPHSKYGRATALTVEQIQNDVIDRFVYAAKLAQQTGFDGVEIYAAHGFLLSQFMSPSTNKRNDQYGGTVENRIRLVLEIYDTIRKELRTDFVIGIKANSVEFQEEGLQTEDAKMMCELIEKRGFDFVELSGGTVERSAFFHEKDSTRQREAFFLEFTDKIRPVFRDTKVFVTGGFRTVTGMVKAVELNSTEGIGIARPVASEPDLPKKILSGEVQGAIKHKFDPDDYRVTSVAAVSSLFLMGKRSLCELDGRIMGDIPDFSRTDEVEHFLKQMKMFMRRIIEMAEQNLPVDAILEYEALHVY